MKNIKIFLITILLFIITSCSSNKENYINATVIRIISNVTLLDDKSNSQSKITKIEVELDSGERVIIAQESNTNRSIGTPEEGDKVVLSEQIVDENKTAYQIIDMKRSGNTYFAIAFFVLCMSIIGGARGLIFFGILLFIFFVLVYMVLPLISLGISPILLTLALSIFISWLINFLIQNNSKKQNLSITSNFLSLIIVTVFAYIFSKYGSFSSFLTKETTSSFIQKITPAGFIASSIILTSLGGIINVCTATLNLSNEVNKNFPKANSQKLMMNLLKYSRQSVFMNFIFIFTIYLGLAMPVMAYKYDVLTLNSFINTDIISFYLIAVSIGGLGIISSSLITSFLSTNFILEERKKTKS
ncbi:MAG: YibE/F family protein [Candidatus Sericytochromatia bacterium]